MSNLKSQMLSWQNWIWIFCTLLTCTPVIHCEYPITPAMLPENNECNGTTAMFNWTYSPPTPDPTSVTWTKRNSDGTPAATLATFAFANFTVDPANIGRVTRTGTTGQIELSNIQSTDMGTYRIEVFDINDGKTTSGTGGLILLEPPIGSLVVTAGDRSLNVSGLTSLGIPAARVICKNEQNEIVVNDTPPFVQSNVSCGTYTCCIESLAVSKCLPSTDPLRTCKVVVIDELNCLPLLIVGIILIVVGIIITVLFVLEDKLRLTNFIYSIIHCAAGFIMMIITAVLACKPLVGLCIGALIVSILNLLYGIGNIIVTLKWKHKSYVWLCQDFCGCSSSPESAKTDFDSL